MAAGNAAGILHFAVRALGRRKLAGIWRAPTFPTLAPATGVACCATVTSPPVACGAFTASARARGVFARIATVPWLLRARLTALPARRRKNARLVVEERVARERSA